ncbi:glycerol dehydratase reactivase beta/small subunit family protein [Lentilactobacillus raoultii]|uniref:Glycerol dehydratase reactivase beta/small subunit family protein n=1 Tax=Lentilactobacillus raoultii TaxID=1987503 RepID=A0ABW3PE32_9LACO|nr:glycerol dehydratase reactivase beta/small subunit family protein [Lentilactobacillus raoultii]
MAIDQNKPAIIIGLPENIAKIPERLIPMLFGIEEEQIPFQFETINLDTAVERAYRAAVISRLSVGISFDDNKIIIHYKNLHPEQPLFSKEIGNPSEIRKMGANAARLVKGVPFKL